MLGVGPQGLGGDATAFAVHVELAATHITMNPVAVNMQCHSARRASAVLTAGAIEYRLLTGWAPTAMAHHELHDAGHGGAGARAGGRRHGHAQRQRSSASAMRRRSPCSTTVARRASTCAGHAVIHTAPNVKQVAPSPAHPAGYAPICVGTTTSARMERFTRPLMERCGVRIVIGKGGLGAESAAAFRELGGVYLAIVGGAAALETTWIEAIEDVDLDDLNPESLWKFRVRGFGPLRVAMDSRGGKPLRRRRRRSAGEARGGARRARRRR